MEYTIHKIQNGKFIVKSIGETGKSRLFNIYKGMLNRCYNEKTIDYKNYGGRGIKICNEWTNEYGFINFYNWSLGNGYDETLSIERKDVNGDYSPDNCTWLNFKGQCNNRRTSAFVEIDGETKTIAQWTEQYNLPEFLVYKRYRKGKRGVELIVPPQRKHASKQSSHVGVRWRDDCGKWEASVYQNGKVKVVGSFINEQEAFDKREEYIKENKLYQYKEVN